MYEDCVIARDAVLSERLAEACARHADSVALIHAGRSVSYGALAASANRLARYLISKGVGPETIVPIAVEPSVERIVAMVGVLFAGGAYLPLDIDSPPERIKNLLDQTNAPLLLSSPSVSEKLSLAGRDDLIVLGDAALKIQLDALSGLPLDRAERDAVLKPENLAYVIYTSGSTGRPKGVGVSHGAICTSLDWIVEELGLSARDRVVHRCDYTFDVSVWEIFTTLSMGGVLILPMVGEARDSARLISLVQRHEATLMYFVPTMLADFIATPGAAGCESLGNIVAIGEALSGALQQRVHETLPAVRFWNSYGPTEAAVGVTLWLCRREEGSRAPPIGASATATQIYLLDDALRPVPDGQPGEICIGGPFLARGYVGRPDLTAERFPPCPFDPDGGRMYRTGDLAERRSDGELYFLGRNDHQIKFNGVRVELGEIEAAVCALPGVERAAVVARELSGENRLIAYVILRPGASPLAPAEAKARLALQLPSRLVPSFMVPVAKFPLTTSGKLDAKALPLPSLDAVKAAYRKPSGEKERLVAAAFARLFGLRSVGADDNFFDLGGTSLTAMRLVACLKAKTGLTIPMRAVVERATPAGLAAVLESLEEPADRPTDLPAGSRPVMFLLPGSGGSDVSLGAFQVACDAALDLRILEYPDWPQLCGAETRFETLADRLADQVASAAPEGVIDLAGYSMGGQIAFEMARNLSRRGREIRFLGIIDTACPSSARRSPTKLKARLTASRDRIVRLIRDQEVGLAMVTNFWRMVPRWAFPATARLFSNGPAGWRQRMSHRLKIAALDKLLADWSPRSQGAERLHAPTVLFSTEENHSPNRCDGWEARCETLRVVPVGGRHLNLLGPDHLQGFVRAFLAACSRAGVLQVTVPATAVQPGRPKAPAMEMEPGPGDRAPALRSMMPAA